MWHLLFGGFHRGEKKCLGVCPGLWTRAANFSYASTVRAVRIVQKIMEVPLEEPPRLCPLVDVIVPPPPSTVPGLSLQVLRCPEDSIGLRSDRSLVLDETHLTRVDEIDEFLFASPAVHRRLPDRVLSRVGWVDVRASTCERRRLRAGAFWIAEGPAVHTLEMRLVVGFILFPQQVEFFRGRASDSSIWAFSARRRSIFSLIILCSLLWSKRFCFA